MEHNIPPPSTPQHRRPDFSSFFAHLSLIDTSSVSNRHALPLPSDISAANRVAAEGYALMLSGDPELRERILAVLLQGIEQPGKEVKGVGEDWCDG